MTDRQIETLSYAVRVRVVLKYFGQLLLVLSVLAMAPLAASLVFAEYHLSMRYGGLIAAQAVLGFALGRLPAPANIQPNEALSVTALVYLFTSLALSWTMTASGLDFSDAFFEALSAITTTGLTTLSSVEDLPRTFLFARAWAQWAGGLGIVVFTVALLFRPGLEAKRLAGIEEAGDLVEGARFHALRVLKVYAVMTAAGIALLVLLGADLFSSLLHVLSAVSTGGFSPVDGGLERFGGWPLQAGAVGLGLAGAISLSLYSRAVRQGAGSFLINREVWALISAAAAVTALLALLWRTGGMPWHDIMTSAPLVALSAQTTTGFSVLDAATLDPGSRLVLILSMATGGCTGSTAGGVKLFRVLVLLSMAGLLVRRTRMPEHAVAGVRVGGRRLGREETGWALLTVLLFILVIVLSWMPFVAMGYGALDSLFEVVSATANAGLSTGIVSPELPAPLRAVLCVDMIMGRLEIVAILVFFSPGNWWGRRTSAT